MSNEKVKKRIKKKMSTSKGRGIIYLGRIPHGFYEDEMAAYFNQFGRVVSTFVPRSRKSGRSKGYGFVEFEDEEVAKIAAETMNNYLMFNRIIKCRFIPPEERKKPRFLKSFGLTVCPRVTNRIKDAKNKRQSFSKLTEITYQSKVQKKIFEFKKFFDERGIDFNFKVNTNNPKKAGNKDGDSKNKEVKCLNNPQDETDDQFGVLEIDSSDAEIHFRIPHQIKKVIKKASSSVMSTTDNSQPWKDAKIKKLKLEETQKTKKNKAIVRKMAQKSEKNSEIRKKSFKNLFEVNKKRLLRKKNEAIKKRKEKFKENVGIASISKKEKKNTEKDLPKIYSRKLSSRKLSGENNNK